MGEIPLYTIQIENPKASQAVLEALAKAIDLEIDLSDLTGQAHAMEEQINSLMDHLKLGPAPGPIGEDEIDHTPKDEPIRVRLGYAFDIGATRKQTQWEKISKDTYEVAFELSLRNHRKEDAVIKVVEPLPGDWSVLGSSLPYKKEDAHTFTFDVKVPKRGETKITYRVRIRWC